MLLKLDKEAWCKEKLDNPDNKENVTIFKSKDSDNLEYVTHNDNENPDDVINWNEAPVDYFPEFKFRVDFLA